MNYVDVDFKRCAKTVSCIFFHLREKTNKCSSKMNSESSNNKNSVDVLSTRYIQFFRFCTLIQNAAGILRDKKNLTKRRKIQDHLEKVYGMKRLDLFLSKHV